ncbi:hypothetical protein HDV00_005079 [Rhizophlyctis rosea]|nr:hypothetical protein HDV00_005079 [Rhizophlyctis rosea]
MLGPMLPSPTVPEGTTTTTAFTNTSFFPGTLSTPSRTGLLEDLSALPTPYITLHISTPTKTRCLTPLLQRLVLHHPIFQDLVTVIHVSLPAPSTTAVDTQEASVPAPQPGFYTVTPSPTFDYKEALKILGLRGVEAEGLAAVVVIEKESGKVLRAWDDVDVHPEKRVKCLETFIEGEFCHDSGGF